MSGLLAHAATCYPWGVEIRWKDWSLVDVVRSDLECHPLLIARVTHSNFLVCVTWSIPAVARAWTAHKYAAFATMVLPFKDWEFAMANCAFLAPLIGIPGNLVMLSEVRREACATHKCLTICGCHASSSLSGRNWALPQSCGAVALMNGTLGKQCVLWFLSAAECIVRACSSKNHCISTSIRKWHWAHAWHAFSLKFIKLLLLCLQVSRVNTRATYVLPVNTSWFFASCWETICNSSCALGCSLQLLH